MSHYPYFYQEPLSCWQKKYSLQWPNSSVISLHSSVISWFFSVNITKLLLAFRFQKMFFIQSAFRWHILLMSFWCWLTLADIFCLKLDFSPHCIKQIYVNLYSKRNAGETSNEVKAKRNIFLLASDTVYSLEPV